VGGFILVHREIYDDAAEFLALLVTVAADAIAHAIASLILCAARIWVTRGATVAARYAPENPARMATISDDPEDS
jgi:hypothetical protein